MTRRAVALGPGALLATMVLLAGAVHCGGDDDDQGAAGSSGGSGGSSASLIEGPRCDVTVTQFPVLPSSHVQECSYLPDDTYNSNPPSSGNHYPVWAAFTTYTQPIPRGYYVHCLEHGAVVFLYNCPEGCADEVSVLQQVAEQLPDDPLCAAQSTDGTRRRVVIVPDPKLPTRFAAAAWGWTLTAPCADPEDFDAFARAHYGQGTEALCYSGTDFTRTALSPGCGEAPTP